MSRKSCSEDYVSTGNPADDHMIEGIPVDSAYQDSIEREDWRDRYRRSDTEKSA